MTYRRLLERDAESLLLCPDCGASGLAVEETALACPGCAARHPFDAEARVCVIVPRSEHSRAKSDIPAFWGDLYRQLHDDNDRALTPERLAGQLDDLEDLFERRRHSCVVEMPISDLAGKKVLEIGSGGGGHSSLFKRHGADLTAVDLTPERAVSTALKLSMIEAGRGVAYQGDAENLPFAEAGFDIVYSNGVLHHSPDTAKCVAEVARVLKPGGLAVVMLYSRFSSAFLFNILPRGLLSGEMFRWPEAEWIGRLTEGKPKFGDTRNPITRVYSKRGMERLFADFEIDSLRKWSFQFDNLCIPRLTQARHKVMTALGFRPHPGGVLVYGAPYVAESAPELWLGGLLGFAWTIAARKPDDRPSP